MDDAAARRGAMVDEQLVRRGIRDARVLDAMRRVPREAFVPPDMRCSAFDDRPLPIGEGQTISQPYMVACMSEELAPPAGCRVLEVGTGSGYQAAILAAMGCTVLSVERVGALAERARRALDEAGYADAVEVVEGDGTLGWPDGAPYDRILVTAGGPQVPPTLLAQLGLGGRLVMPVGNRWSQELMTVDRTRDGWRRRTGLSCVFVPLLGAEGWDGAE